jgi:hypothetical protein
VDTGTTDGTLSPNSWMVLLLLDVEGAGRQREGVSVPGSPAQQRVATAWQLRPANATRQRTRSVSAVRASLLLGQAMAAVACWW